MNIFTRFGQFLLMIRGMFTRPENMRMYWKELMHQCSELGIGSLGIVSIISLFIGAVSTVQTAYQFVSPIIPRSVIAQIVRDSVILEFAPTITCIVLAGVVGSKISSELGNMRVSEQIDALEMMGINTKAYLILPKIMAAMITIPLLVIIAMTLGIWGGRFVGDVTGILPHEIYDRGLVESFVPYNVTFALTKAYTFSFIITAIPAYFGYNVRGGALEIGRSSTTAVVVSCVVILLADYILAQVLL
ncbi:MAG: ABC transporter permease [Bacteroidetes bacterium]|nr:ABC transporter permease [Bacteroidota bacterium]